MKNYFGITAFLFAFLSALNAQNTSVGNLPDPSPLGSSTRHWYSIFDEKRVIEPLEDQQRYALQDYVKIADNILLFQKDNGGWAKNYDMLAILSEQQKQAIIDSKNDLNTTFDNGATHGQLTYLARVYTLTSDDKYKKAFLKGLAFVFDAQYENGGWPQFYPDSSGYRKHITFNDDAMTGIMNMMQKIVYKDPDYQFIDDATGNRILRSYQNGIECILKCQIEEQGKKTAWCQQHDHITFAPCDARDYEKASICNGESCDIVKFLMQIKNPGPEIKKAVAGAVEWFKESAIHAIRVERIDAPEEKFIYHTAKYDMIVVKDPGAPLIWARFYELGTHKPIFCGLDGIVRYSMAEIDRDRRTGYAWYHYAPEEVLTLYKQWAKDNLENGG